MAVIALPWIWPAVVAAAEATAVVVGGALTAVAVKETVDAIDQALDEREKTGTRDITADRTCERTCPHERKCPPCVPPVGTIRVERVDRVPPSRPHAPCPGDHAHLVQRNQAPYPNCKCFWNKARPDVICLGPGDPLPYPMK
jgi:type VI secretion system secreted protein VgrG